MKMGIYWNRTTNEAVAISADDAALPEGSWLHITDERGLGLLAIRKLLIDNSLADDATTTYWYMPQPIEEIKLAPRCNAPATGRSRHGPLARLRDIFGASHRPRHSSAH